MAQELLPGQEPLLLEGFISMGRSLPESTGEAQHIAYKLLYDAANEAIINVYRAANRIRVSCSSLCAAPLWTAARSLVWASVRVWVQGRDVPAVHTVVGPQVPSWMQEGRRVVRPLPPHAQLVAQVTEQVQAWLAVRAASDAELDKLLVTDAGAPSLGSHAAALWALRSPRVPVACPLARC